MPPKRTSRHAMDLDSQELPARGTDPGGLNVLLQTVYSDLRTAHVQLSIEQARIQSLENQIRNLDEQANQLKAAIASKDTENALLRAEVSRLSSQPSPLSRQPSLPDIRKSRYIFHLEKRAKSSGGDKFVCESQPDFNIYFPQTISRQDAAAPCQSLNLLIERPMIPASHSPSVLIQPHNILNMVNVKSESFKQEPLSDDDDKPLVSAGRAQ